MSDLIDRVKAVGALEKYWEGISERHQTLDGEMAIYADCKRIIRDFPSADSDITELVARSYTDGFDDGYKQCDSEKWIQCGDRLPDEDFHTGLGRQFSDYVLVTVINHANDHERFVDVAYTQDGTWRMAHADDGDFEVPYWCEIVAWRSLSKPFMEEHDGCMDV